MPYSHAHHHAVHDFHVQYACPYSIVSFTQYFIAEDALRFGAGCGSCFLHCHRKCCCARVQPGNIQQRRCLCELRCRDILVRLGPNLCCRLSQVRCGHVLQQCRCHVLCCLCFLRCGHCCHCWVHIVCWLCCWDLFADRRYVPRRVHQLQCWHVQPERRSFKCITVSCVSLSHLWTSWGSVLRQFVFLFCRIPLHICGICSDELLARYVLILRLHLVCLTLFTENCNTIGDCGGISVCAEGDTAAQNFCFCTAGSSSTLDGTNCYGLFAILSSIE